MKPENKKETKKKLPEKYELKESEPSVVQEPSVAYNSIFDYNKHYTYADYLTWIDDKMRELIGGIVRLMSAPTSRHASISGEIYYEMYNYVKKQKGNCKVFHAPFDVRLPKKPEDIQDDKIDTVVQPDVCVICDPSKIDERGCIGAPDMVVEVLSSSSENTERQQLI